MGKKVTLDVIAKHLGLSKFAVSKALSGKSGVSQQTRERVIQAATQFGYFVQRGAVQSGGRPPSEGSDERSGDTGQVVLVLMSNIRHQSVDSLYWGKIVEGVSDELNRRGLSMIIISDFKSDHLVNLINPQMLAGVICIGYVATTLLLEMRQASIPFATVDHDDPLVPSDSIFVNNVDCISRITNYLLGLGHKVIQFVGDNQYSNSFNERWIGFRSAMEAGGREITSRSMLRLTENDRFSHSIEVKRWLHQTTEQGALPTALVCANDAIAISATQALRELNLRVPEDMAVTGFDNIDDAFHVVPPLTTVHVDKQEMGRRAVESLCRRLTKAASLFEKVLLSGSLVIRDSAAKPARRAYATKNPT